MKTDLYVIFFVVQLLLPILYFQTPSVCSIFLLLGRDPTHVYGTTGDPTSLPYQIKDPERLQLNLVKEIPGRITVTDRSHRLSQFPAAEPLL
jgi:hypothetical protein